MTLNGQVLASRLRWAFSALQEHPEELPDALMSLRYVLDDSGFIKRGETVNNDQETIRALTGKIAALVASATTPNRTVPGATAATTPQRATPPGKSGAGSTPATGTPAAPSGVPAEVQAALDAVLKELEELLAARQVSVGRGVVPLTVPGANLSKAAQVAQDAWELADRSTSNDDLRLAERAAQEEATLRKRNEIDQSWQDFEQQYRASVVAGFHAPDLAKMTMQLQLQKAQHDLGTLRKQLGG